MNKQEFLEKLKSALKGLPQDDIDERLSFYSEMIDDRMEEGLTEEQAVAAAGPISDIVSQTLADIPLTKLVREKVKSERKPSAWNVVLLILGFPLWFPLLVAVAAVLLSLYVVAWSLIVSLWAIEISLIACAAACVVAAVWLAIKGMPLHGAAAFGAALVLAGLSILMFAACKAATGGLIVLTKKIAMWIKHSLFRRESSK